ncbi:MAG TPA: hypothetical protein VFT46_07180 [Holophagaceae bacterium]|nr:hypothetical protein [Holophagaceae bacterium]
MRERARRFVQGFRDPATEQAMVLWGLIAAVFWSIVSQGFTWEKGSFLVFLVGLRFGPAVPPPPAPPAAPAV